MRWSALTAVPVAAAAAMLFSCDDPFEPPARAPAPGLALVGAAASGSWSTPVSWPLIAAHLGVLPDGRVISWVSGYVAGDVEVHHVYVWNPTMGSFTEMTHGTENIFCSGNALLPDGRLLIPGGHISDSRGLKDTYLFDWASNTWQEASPMRAGRWYPTTTVLANGYASVVGGTEEDGSANLYPEIWNGTGWRLLRGARLNMLYYYPWMHPAPDGRVFNSGPDFVSRYLNPSGGGEWKDAPRSRGGVREYGGSIMYAPGKILIVGGGDPPTNTAETIDLNTGSTWQFTGSMRYRRRQMNATVLPDGKVLVIGGTAGSGFNDESQPVFATELWNPQTGTWTTLASLQIPRLYHSAAVLLPDARVLAAGGGRCETCTDHYDAQLFSPPYLFAADGSLATRPTITVAPTSVSYGQTFQVGTPQPSAIVRVSWVRLPVTTHTFDQNQWTNQLTFTKTATALNVSAPASAYLAPPGHYMLFILNGSGVPSVAKIVQLQGSAALPAAPGRPAAPTNLFATSIDAHQIRLNWADNSTSETDFLIEQCLGTGCTDFAEVASVDPQVDVYQVGSLSTGTAYTFRVRARNDAGYSSYSNSASGTTTTGGTITVRTIVSQLAGKCMEVEGGRQLNGTHMFITPCTGATYRQWTVPPAGYAGDIRMFGTMCFDAYGGQGNPGDRVELWECAGRANQRWTLTATGELRGFTGLCVTLNGGAAADSTGMALQPCTGAPAQKWSYGSVYGNLPPVAQFTYACTSLACSFNDSSTDDGSVTAWSWTFGDGGSSTARNPSHTYAAAGSYQVTLIATDNSGTTGSITQTVTVAAPLPTNVPPIANFTSSCTDLTCSFTDGSIDSDGSVTAWSWTFGDGGSSTTRNPSHTYAAAGSYGVTLIATDNSGTTGSITQTVTVAAPLPTNAPPIADFTSSCTGLTCSFTDGSTDSDGSVTAWSWTFGDAGSSTARNPSYTYASGGTYTVTLTVTDDDGAPNQRSVPVTVTAPPVAAPRLSDSFNRVVATGAGTADGGSDASKSWVTWEGANPDVKVDGSALVLTKDAGAWRGLVGTESSANIDGSVEVSSFNSDAALLGFYLRVSGGPADNYQFQWTEGALTIWRSTTAGGDVVLATVAQARNAAFKLRAQVETGGTSVILRLKYWTGGTEPAGWTLTATDTSPNRIMSGGYGLRVLNGGTSDMRIDNFVANNLVAPLN